MALQQLNPFPLNINPKQDSWDKLQLLQYLDPSLKVTAAELNKIVDALNYLYGNVNVGDYMGNIPIKLQIVNVDHSLPSSTAAKVVAVVNAMPNYLLQNGVAHWFYTQRMVLSSGTGIVAGDLAAASYAVITEYFILGKKIAPIGGSSSIGVGGTPLTVGDLVALPRKDSRNFAPQEFNLGNIGTTTIEQAVNTTGPRATPNTATIIFRANQNGEEKVWLYLGAQENVGVGFPPVGADVFRLFPADGSGADPEPPSVALKFQVYDDIEEMLIRQREQSRNDLILVMDASEDPTLTFTEAETKLQALYKLKSSVKTEALEDYIVVAAPFHGETFDPSDYDLDDFNNESADPFVRESEIPEPTPTPNLQQVTDAGFTTHNPIAFSEFGSTKKAHFNFDSIKLSEGEGMGLINKGTLFYPFPKNALIPETLATQEWTREQSNFTTQEIASGGNYNDLEVTADLLIFTNENAQAILNGVWGRKEFHILNLSETYGLRINHDSSSVADPEKRIKLPTAGGSVDIKGTARVLQTDDYGYFVADTWGSKYRPEFTGLTEKEVITVDPNSEADTMPMRELYVYRDAQTTPMTDAELNIAYPNATRPFQVICKELNLIYLKEDDVNNIWTAIPLIQNDFPKLHSIKKTFTGAEVENWDTAPLELIPPVGAGYLIDVISAHHMAHNGTSFSEDPEIRYSDALTAPTYWSMLGLNFNFNQVLEFKSAGGRIKSIGAGLVLTGSGGVMDGELDVYITYQIIKL